MGNLFRHLANFKAEKEHTTVTWTQKKNFSCHLLTSHNLHGYEDDFRSDVTLTKTLNLTSQTMTQHLSLLRLHLTSKALLELSEGSYSPKTSEYPSNSQTYHYFAKILLLKDKDESSHRQGAVYKIKCWGCRPFILVRRAEIWTYGS